AVSGRGRIPKASAALVVASAFAPRVTISASALLLELCAEASEAPSDAACDRAGGNLELDGDRPVALVAGEEAVEDVLARLGQPCASLANRERSLDLGEVGALLGRHFLVRRQLPSPARDGIQTPASRELRDPRTKGRVVAKRVETRVDPREHVLEDVLGILLAQPESANADGVDVPGVALDELVPRFRISRAAPADDLGVRHHGVPTHRGRVIDPRREGARRSR